MKRLQSILLVDDDPINNFISDTLFKKINVADEVRIFQSPREALNYLAKNCNGEQNCPDLILVDVNMPSMDGFEFIREVKNLNISCTEKVMFAMISTMSDFRDESAKDELNIECLINKPLTEEKFSIIMDRFYKHRSQNISGKGLGN